MSTIPTSVTEEQFEEHIESHLRIAKRGFVSKIALYKMFDYILIKNYTPDANGRNYPWIPIRMIQTKRKLVGMPFTTIIASVSFHNI